jgi:putative ABC transport system permease protein
MDRPISVLLLVAIIIGIAVMGLTSYTAITDRGREYSLLKAVGASGFQLNRLIVTEGLVMGLISLLVGIGLAFLSASLIMAYWPQFNVVIRLQSLVSVSLLALGMTLVSALLPVRRLAAIDPLEAFKA